MLQNAAPLRNSAPGPPNISDERVSCTAPATRDASLRLPSFLKLPQYPHVLLTFDKAHTHTHTTPCTCHKERHLNVHKWSKPASLLHCWLGHVLRATAACVFSTPQLPKVLRTLACFYHFNFQMQMCFPPQRRAIFHHSSCQVARHSPL